MEETKEKFLKAYTGVPDPLRNEIIVIIDQKPYSWNTSYFEIKNNTELSKKILNTLLSMKII